jgi:hypothetical protein
MKTLRNTITAIATAITAFALGRTLPLALALACLWLALGKEAAAQGTIRYVQPPEPIYVTQGVFENNFSLRVPLDINGDGTADFEFSGGILGVAVQALKLHAQAAVLAIPPDLHSWLVPLPDETTIGESLPVGITWVDQDTPGHPVPGSSSVSGCTSSGCIGLFQGVNAYMGVRLVMGDGLHYGWVRMDSTAFSGGGVILDWAYETRPGIPILAGAVPEPSTWALLIGGGMLTALFRRKKIGRKR